MSAPADLRTVKVYLSNDEVRRFKVDMAASGPYAWPAFQAKAFEVFNGETLVFKYTDADGDLVTVANADDYEQLLAEQPAGSPLRLFASTPAESEPNSESEHIEPNPEPEHSEPEPEEAVVAPGVEAAEARRVAAEEAATVAAVAAAKAQRAAEAAAQVAAEEEVARVAAARAVAEAEIARIQAEAEAAEAARKAAIEAELRKPVTHPTVTCSASGQSPLTGTRYHKVGQNVDLSEAEFAKLPEPEKQLFEIILRPGAAPIRYEPIIHYGIQCDGSGTGPIIGLRCHKIGEDHDLSQPEFAKLDEEEKRLFELIASPRAAPVPYYEAKHDHPAGKVNKESQQQQRAGGHYGVTFGNGCPKRQCCPGMFIFGMFLFTTLFGPRSLMIASFGLGAMKALGLSLKQHRKTATAIVVMSIVKCCCLFAPIALSLILQASGGCCPCDSFGPESSRDRGATASRCSRGPCGPAENSSSAASWCSRGRASRCGGDKDNGSNQAGGSPVHVKQE